MRTIKFRAWSLKDKCYLNSFAIFYNGDFADMAKGVMHNNICQCDINYQKTPDDIIIEQFTGLHDKNGVEIYEGDVVHLYYYRQNDLGETLWFHRNVLVKWSDDDTFYGIGGWDGDDYFDIATRYRHSIQEVIGNIHEGELK